MSYISAHVYYACERCDHLTERDYGGMETTDDYPDTVECSCGGSASEDGADVFVDGAQVEYAAHNEANFEDDDDLWNCPHCEAELCEKECDEGECWDCGNTL